jgi:hypothetical protein
MEKVLQKKDKPGEHQGTTGWRGERCWYLYTRLVEEVAELGRLLDQDVVGATDVIKEAADVGNFAMFIADNYGRGNYGS